MFMEWKINIVKMSIPPKAIYRFNAIPIQIPTEFFRTLENIISQFVWKYKKPRIAKAILRKMNGTGGVNLPDFRLHYEATVIKKVWSWHKDRKIDQWNKIESPEINPHTYGQLFFDTGGKNIQQKKENVLNQWCWKNQSTTSKRMKLWRTVWIFLKKLEMNCHMTQQSHFWAYTPRKPDLKETRAP